jgi:PAS domain S-box-containing protein
MPKDAASHALRYQLAARATNDAIWDWDLDTGLVSWNEAVHARFGHAVEETDADWWRAHIHPEDRDRVLDSIHAVIEGSGERWEADYRFLRADGEWAEVLDRGYVLRAEDGRPLRMIGAMIDFTERRRAAREVELERSRLRAVVDAFPVGIFIADGDGRLVEINEQARRIWGEVRHSSNIAEYGEYKAWRHDTGDPISADDWGLARALTFGEVSVGEVLDIERFDGTRATILNSAAPVRGANGEVIGGVVVELDVTEQKRIEDELKDAKEVAEAASRAKDEFLATVSHELRTPLTSILGWARMIRLPGLEPELFAEALDSIERNAKSQAQLIDDILDVSRIVNGKMRLTVEAIDLRAVVDAAMATIRPAANAKNVAVHATFPHDAVRVSGDADRLQQVAWNLLSNAVKFTPGGGSVTIEVLQERGEARLVVRDSGQGIEPRFLPHVFERFRQADTSSSRPHGGLGLGLAIVRHIVELHGGVISAHSDGYGQGATFTIALPLSRLASELLPDGPAVADCPPDFNGLRVLVVDDQPDTQRVLTALLERCGAAVTTASSAAEALALLDATEHDVLLSDIGMPGGDGYSLVRALRSSTSRGAAIPAIALTAYARDEDRTASLAAGFQSFVPKPVEPNDLLTVVASLARR